jgi:uncharacterized membrane protein
LKHKITTNRQPAQTERTYHFFGFLCAMLSHLHPVIVHIPIVLVLFACWYSWRGHVAHTALHRSNVRLLWITTAFFTGLACLTGWLLQSESGAVDSAGTWHKYLNISVLALSCACILLPLQKALASLTALVLCAGAYTGATLTHGAAFLVTNAHAETEMAVGGTFSATNVPAEEPSTPDIKAIEALRKRGAIIMPVAAESHWLSVNCVNAPTFSNQDAALLVPLADQIVWLKVNNTAISDSALLHIGQLKQLTRLHLDGTNVTRAGLGHLAQLQRLQLLNLSHTKLVFSDVEILASLPALKKLYLFGVPVTATEYSRLIPIFAHTQLDTGRYQVPTLPTDTARLKAQSYK